MAKVFKRIEKIIKDVVEAVVDVVAGVFSAIGSAIAGIFGGFAPDVPSANTSASPDGVLVTKSGSNLDIPVIYGFRRVGGRIIFAETNGESNKYLYVIYVIAEGEINQIRNIYVDDIQIPLSNYTPGQVYNASGGRFDGRLSWEVFNGTETQDESLLANGAPSWNAGTRKLPGVAYAVMRFEWKKIETQEQSDANPYRGGIPSVQFDVEGKKVYNVLTHAGGEDLSSDYSGLTKTYSYNPVNCLLDYLMNPRYGCGIDKSEINADSFKTAARKCNQKVYYDGDQTQGGKIITINAVVSVQSKLLDNVKMLLSGARAFMPYIQGRYKITIEDGGNATDITSASFTSAFDVTTDHLVSSVSLQGEQKQNKFNQVIVRYVDPGKEFTEQQVSYSESADVTADGEDLIGDFQFLTISNEAIAYDLARMIYKKSRKQRYIAFSATPEILAAEPGDIITVTSSVLNLSNDTFRITNMNFDANGTVQVQAREHDATLYPFVSSNQIVTPAKTFAPDVYNLTPISPVQPATPIQVAPPDDPEPVITGYDSAGEPIEESASTDNDEPVPAPDIQSQGNVLKIFETISSVGLATSAVPVYPGTNNIVQITRRSSASAFDTFSFNRPADQTIDKIRILSYNSSGVLINTTDRPIYYDGYPVLQRVSVLNPAYSVAYYELRWLNSSENKEYEDGSTGDYDAQSYVGRFGALITGKNLTAVVNYQFQNSGVIFEVRPAFNALFES